MPKHESPRLSLEGSRLIFTTHEIEWELKVSEIRVIGECTTPQGPFDDDYFLVFVTGPDRFFRAPVSCLDSEQTLNRLLKNLDGSHIQFGLANITQLASRVIWPPSLADQELFEFREVESTGLGKWLGKLGFPPEIQLVLRAPTLSYVSADD